jgi:hypothetical protein
MPSKFPNLKQNIPIMDSQAAQVQLRSGKIDIIQHICSVEYIVSYQKQCRTPGSPGIHPPFRSPWAAAKTSTLGPALEHT